MLPCRVPVFTGGTSEDLKRGEARRLRIIWNYADEVNSIWTNSFIKAQEKMKSRFNILAMAIGFGLFIWFMDGVLDYLIFYKNQGTLWQLLVTQIPPHEIFIRSLIIACFIVFGLIVSTVMARLEKNERALRESEKYHKRISSLTSDYFYSLAVDTDGTIAVDWIDGAFQKVTGLAEDEIRDISQWLSHIHPDDLSTIQDGAQAILANQPSHIEYRLRTGSGDECWLRDSSHPIWDDEQQRVVGVLGAVQDITNRKRSAEALRAEQEKALLYLEIAVVGIIALDLDGRITLINRQGYKMLGYEPAELIGRNWFDTCLPERSREEVRDVFKQLIRGDIEPVEYYENPALRKDGEERIVAWHNSYFRDQSGMITGILSAGEDITDRKKAEEDRDMIEAQLHQAQKMEAIGTLAGGIAHDFNNILSSILCYADLARDGLPVDSATRLDIEQIQAASLRAAALVGQILTFSRQAEDDVRPLTIAPIIMEALKMLRSSLPSTTEIRQNLSEAAGQVLADPTQIHQVIMNLCTNAAHAMGEKGGLLEVGLQEVEIELSDSPDFSGLAPGSYLALTVSDTGDGMGPEVMKRIFDPFYTTKEHDKGTGLGLSVVHGIVKSLGGAISVNSEVGEGTTFRILLPQLDETAPSQVEETADIPAGKERILIVDDEAPLVRSMARMLDGLGYQVTFHDNSREALEGFRGQPDEFDLVVTDLTMPELTGFELAREILQIRPKLPILICTGFSEHTIEARIKVAGIFGLLKKPITKRELAVQVRQALDAGVAGPVAE